jgi:predicted nucleic acid-binding Zn ribbon protein
MIYKGSAMEFYMSPELSDHDHCRYCGDCVPSDQAYCSVECYYKDQEVIRKEKFRDVFWSAAALIGVAVILALGILF